MLSCLRITHNSAEVRLDFQNYIVILSLPNFAINVSGLCGYKQGLAKMILLELNLKCANYVNLMIVKELTCFFRIGIAPTRKSKANSTRMRIGQNYAYTVKSFLFVIFQYRRLYP